MDLPLPIPDELYTLRSLERYLADLTLESTRNVTFRHGYDYRRSTQILYRIATIYRRITGIEFGTMAGRTSEILVFTREQFELFAVVVCRSTMDGTSYEYNLRRELNLPDEGYGLLTKGEGGASATGAPASSRGDVNLQREVTALRSEVAELTRRLEARAGETIDSGVSWRP